MQVINKLIVSFAVAATMCACAEKTETDYNTIEQISLNEWVRVVAPTKGLDYQSFGDGMFIMRYPEVLPNEKIEDGDWVLLNYIGLDLEDNVFVNRYNEVARQLGTYAPRIHYAPQLVKVTKTGGNITKGQYEALLTMKTNQEVDLLMPSRLAYSSSGASFSDGYQGNVSLEANKPCRILMIATKRILDISAYEEKQVKEYALANLNIKDENDTIAPSLYLEVSQPNDKARPIGEDSTFKYTYTAYFMDGFVLDTNVPETALKLWNQVVAAGSTVTYPNSSGTIDAFKRIAKSGKLSYGCTFKMVFTSKYGYGTSGQAGSTTAPTVQPYTPLIFECKIEAHPKGDKPDEDPKK